jgi:hypothetical protein
VRLAAAAALVLLAACAHGAKRLDEDGWTRAREAHTRSAKAYDGLAQVAFATATWQSSEVRAARVDRVARWKAMTPAERSALQAEEDAAAASFDEFTVSLFTSERAENDLDAKKTNWRIALVAGDGEALPAQVTNLRIDAELRELYPAIGDFDLVYQIRFPKQALGTQPFVLRIAGPRGKLDFPFRRADAPPAAARAASGS